MTDAVLTRQICLFSNDSEMAARLAAVARAHGVGLLTVGSAGLATLASSGGILLIDLEQGEEATLQAIQAARSSDSISWYVCGYGSRLDYESLSRIRDLGADRVLSRSRVVLGLQDLLVELFGPSSLETS
jgi:hypothetical protein